jgi:hypothetical protein
MLFTGLGFEVGFIVFRRTGKPQTIDCSTRSPTPNDSRRTDFALGEVALDRRA